MSQKCSKVIQPQFGVKHRFSREPIIAHLFINFTDPSATQSSLTHHKSPPSDLVASQLNPFHILTCIKSNFDIILSHMPRFYDKSFHSYTQIMYVFLVSCKYVTRITFSISHLILTSAPNHDNLKFQPYDTVHKRYFRPPASAELVTRTRDWKR